MDLLKRREITNKIALTLSMAAMVFGLFWLAWILFTTLQLGVAGLSLDLFTKMTPPPGAAEGGLANVARRGYPFHQQHSPVGALDRHRPLCLRHLCGPGG